MLNLFPFATPNQTICSLLTKLRANGLLIGAIMARGSNAIKIEEETHIIKEKVLNLVGDNIDELLIKLDPYLRPEKVARFLDVSDDFIYDRVARGEIESQRVGKRLKRIRMSSVIDWLKSQSKDTKYGKKK